MKNQIENNSLLAEFLGSEIEETLKGEKVYCLLMPDENDISGLKKEFFAPDELKFHKSWDWLMLVVNKILVSKVGRSDFDLQGGCNTETTYSFQIKVVSNFGLNVVSGHANDLLLAVYKACIEFVKWYNSQNK